jgi:hypothetical protein
VPQAAADAPPPTGRRAPQPKPKPKGKARQRSFEEVLTEARTATVTWTEDELTAERLRTTLKVSQDNARKVRDTLKAERADQSGLHAVTTPEEVAA